MFIRKTKVKNARNGGEDYYTFRIVETERLGQKVRQRTLLNLGKHFAIDPGLWSLLCSRIDQLLHNKTDLFGEISLEPELEVAAQHYAASIIDKQGQPAAKVTETENYHCVDVNRLEVCRPRTIGVESIAHHAMEQLALPQCLSELGFNGKDLAASIGQIVGRLASPGSECHTLQWLQKPSGLGELLDHDFEKISLTRLYEVSDKLYAHRLEIEKHLCQREADLFALDRRIILYDLTNTYFEGQALRNPKAQLGRSKEKRSDCRLVTLGLVLDGNGFPLHSHFFEGNVSEPGTLEEMIERLSSHDNHVHSKPIIIMDAGIATEENIATLRNQDYHYIVVSRDQNKQMPSIEQGALVVKDEPNNQVIVEKVSDESEQEVRVYCHSQGKVKKEQSIHDKASQRFEQALTQLNEGLSKKGGTKKYEKIMERIGRIKQKNSRVAQRYQIEVIADDDKINAQSILWEKTTAQDAYLGVYCLRTNIMDWEADELWRTYVMLTEVEATFRSLKTDFGLRPVYHHKEDRVSAHSFISLLAYHVAHALRIQLKNQGIHISWNSLRQCLSTQQRVTVTLPTKNQGVVHARTTSRAEAEQQPIFTALGIPADRLGRRLTSIEEKSSQS